MRHRRIVALLAGLAASGVVFFQAASAQQVGVSFQVFYDELSPHGVWVEYPKYGYVWMPTGTPGFVPYATAGHWVLTEYGWTWVSDYPWGWATFHYGRWDHDGRYGWFWVPGRDWGPAWVSWRRAPGYYGWAPLRPGVSVSMAVGGGHHGLDEHWTFVKDTDITKREVIRHLVDRSRNSEMIKTSAVVTNTQKDKKHNVTYIAGPEKGEVEQVTKTTLKPVAVRENEKPGNQLTNSELKMYRPEVKVSSGKSPAPAKVMKLSEVKPKEGKPQPEENSGKKGDKKEMEQ